MRNQTTQPGGDAFDIIRRQVQAALLAHNGPLFHTDADLWQAYLDGFATAEERQHHNCHACRQFINRWGGLVTVDDKGRQASAMWGSDDMPEAYRASVGAMARLARRGHITGVCLLDGVAGQPVTGVWTHFSFTPPPERIFQHARLTPGQRAAELREDVALIRSSLAIYPVEIARQAYGITRHDTLSRAEAVRNHATWFLAMHNAVADAQVPGNLLWRIAAEAPPGYAHTGNTMLGTLLDDIRGGGSIDDIRRKFAAKMDPLKYQRPQSLSQGQIDNAEKVVRDLGIERSLERRMARLDEVPMLWSPVCLPDAPDSVFGHLKPTGMPPAMTMPPVAMTWVKFEAEVLPTAKRIEIDVPTVGSFIGLTTAVHADAPPILQWDTETNRNPVAWYVYHSGSTASNWRLNAGMAAISGIALQPHMWGDMDDTHHGQGVVFFIEGARETRGGELGLFPEILKGSMRDIRHAIEALSKGGRRAGLDEGSACGLLFSASDRNRCRLKVTSNDGIDSIYDLDRWD